MAKNLCINYFRKIAVKKRASDYFRIIYSQFYFDDAVVAKEHRNAFYEAVRRLTIKERSFYPL
jgi:DNA-directed RNA polymerase specialized sigma24 family protein